MEIGPEIGIPLMVFSTLLGVCIGMRSILTKRRAEQNLQVLLRDAPGRDELAEQILRNPDTENLQKGREFIIKTLESLSPKDRKEISSGLFQDSVRGRAWYVAKLITGGRTSQLDKVPTDEKVTA